MAALSDPWARRLADKIREQSDDGGASDSDDDAEATGAIVEFLDDLYPDRTTADVDRVLRALLHLVEPG